MSSSIQDFIQMLQQRNVRLWIDGENLCLEAPSNVLSDAELGELRSRKPEFLSFLANVRTIETPILPLPRTAESRFSLSSQQKQLWFLQEYSGSTPAYHIGGVVKIVGELHRKAFREALLAVIARHEILRTTFADQNGEPVQHIEALGKLAFTEIDLTHLEPIERAVRVESLAAEQLEQPFALGALALFTTTLVKTSEQEHVLIVVIHHIVADLWSVRTLIDNLVELYSSCDKSEDPRLKPLPIQYADYCAWQQTWLQSEAARDQLRFWRERLRTAQPLQFPRTAPATGGRGGMRRFTIPQPISTALKSLATDCGATAFMAWLAVYQVFLSLLTNQEDIVTVSPIAGRTRLELDALVGLFANTLLLRTRVSAAGSFVEQIDATRRCCMEAFANEDLPFDKVVADLHTIRPGLGTALARAGFSLQTDVTRRLSAAGLTFEVQAIQAAAPKNDLTLTIREQAGDDVGIVEYAGSAFDASQCARLAESFVALARSLVDAPNISIASVTRDALAMIRSNPVDARAAVSLLHGARRSLPAGRTIHGLISENLARHASRVAIAAGDRQLTYDALECAANRLAHFLRRQGAGPRTSIAICFDRSPERIVGMLGVLKSGAAYLPMDPATARQRLQQLLANAKPRFVLTQQRFSPLLDGRGVEVIAIDSYDAEIAECPNTAPDVGVCPNDIAYIMYTSGSTGEPKGVMATHANATNHNVFMREEFALTPEDKVLQFASYCFDASVEEIFPTLMAGATLVLRESAVPSVQELNHQLAQAGITVLNLPTAYWHSWIGALEPVALAQLRLVVVGGERVSAESVRKWRELPTAAISWMNTYGPTEGTVTCTCYRLPATSIDAADIPIGSPIWNTSIYILGEDRNPVPLGEVGELFIGGEGVAAGYVNDAALTAELFQRDPFSDEPHARMYRTGDQARCDADGTVRFVGRRDQQVKVRGHRVEPAEIEYHIRRWPTIRDAVVVAMKDEAETAQLAAYVVGDINQASLEDLRRHLESLLPQYMIPTSITVLETLPLNNNGKLDRGALPSPAPQRGIICPPIGPTELQVAEIWKVVLRLPDVDRRDNFFEIGGHSLLAVQVASRIAKSMGHEIHVKDIFAYPTIESLARFLDVLEQRVADIVPSESAHG